MTSLNFLNLLWRLPRLPNSNLSFEAAPALRRGRRDMTFNPLDIAIKMAGATLGSIERAPLRLNALVLERAFGTASLFAAALTTHYIAQVCVRRLGECLLVSDVCHVDESILIF